MSKLKDLLDSVLENTKHKYQAFNENSIFNTKKHDRVYFTNGKHKVINEEQALRLKLLDNKIERIEAILPQNN